MRWYLLIWFSLMTILCRAQDFIYPQCYTIQVLSDSTKLPISTPKGGSFFTQTILYGNEVGIINTNLPLGDSIRIAVMGYYPQVIQLSNLSTYMINCVYLKPYSYMLPEVKIRSHLNDSVKITLHMPDDIKMGRINNTPMRLRSNGAGDPQNVGSMIFNPINAIYNGFSKEVASKQKVYKLMQADSINRNFYYVIMNKDIIAEESGFTGDSLQSFIVLCNTHIKLTRSMNEYSVRLRINSLANGVRNNTIKLK